MNIWVCQYLSECVDGDIIEFSKYFWFAIWMVTTGLITLFATIREPKKSQYEIPMPLGILLVVALSLGLIIMIVIKGAFFIVLNFETSFLVIFSAIIFAIATVISSVIIRNRR